MLSFAIVVVTDSMNKNKLVYIGGPTCSGKTNLSIVLAETFNTEIISCDSRQIYSEISIGTAKPFDDDLKKNKHHFINHISIHDNYNVGIYYEQSIKALESIFKTKETAILVGGSGLYADSLINGIDHFPKVKNSVKQTINLLLKNEGMKKLNSMLKKYDPEYYSIVDKNNARRVIRALEVCLSSGKPFVSFFKKRRKNNLFEPKILLMNPERKELYKKISNRVDKMISLGLEKEAKKLFKYKDLNSLQTVGYNEFFKYFEGKCSYKNTIEEIKKNTRRYAKRQITWNKKYKEAFLVNENCKLNEIINFINK
jgi:tRNA dimethylallyltransferase